jgi:hypothetical protein
MFTGSQKSDFVSLKAFGKKKLLKLTLENKLLSRKGETRLLYDFTEDFMTLGSNGRMGT